ncbi:MAG: hypothetical protein HKN63_11780 [Rhodobacteraceae bacterium]|nr:hypothetical protein [Paracoccaceae bacterium]
MKDLASYPTTEFTCAKPGDNSQAQAKGAAMEAEAAMAINGNADLSKVVTGNSGACVYGVTLVRSPGIYAYRLQIDAQGPRGIGSGSLHLVFEDETGDRYKLFLFSSGRSVHTVSYNSKKPGIRKLEWHN